MSTRNRNILPNNLAQLQNLIKRDPESYREEFMQQWRHFQSNLEVFLLSPSAPSEAVAEMAMFIAQVSNCYETDVKALPDQIIDLLSQHFSVMHVELRMNLCKALILLRNKNMVSPLKVLQLFFKLLRANDKLLRKTLYNHIISDIKRVNAKHKNNKINTSLQNFMFTMLQDNSKIAAKMSVDILIELYRKNIWNDTKTVNVLVTACLSKITKVKVAALQFFLGSDSPQPDKDKDSDSESEDENTKAKKLLVAGQVSKKTNKKQRKLEKALTLLRKSKNKKKPLSFNFSAIHLINDPQGFAESLFKCVEHSTELFEVKLMILNLIARLVGIHELILLNFYPFLQRFLQPHQREVTKLLMFAAQAAHEMVPPDTIEAMLMTVANNFVSEKNNNEVMAVGLNAIREICARSPYAMTEDLLQDLVQYKTSKSKTVMMSARSLLQLYRDVDPSLLHRKDRGRPTEESSTNKSVSAKEFGASNAVTFVPGAEVLEETKENEEEGDEDEDSANEEWEECSDRGEESDDDGEWVDVSQDEDEGEDEEGKDEGTFSDNEKKAESVSMTRILTDDEFKKIAQENLVTKMHGTKRKASSSEKSADVIDLAQIENVHKKMRHDKESRLATVLQGREGRDKYARQKQKRQNEHASTTNKEKQKSKPFMMMSHSKQARGKNKKSFRDKQIALRDSLLKNEGIRKNNKKRK